MALSDYKNDIYTSKEIILSVCRAIEYDSVNMKFETVYPMDKSMYYTISGSGDLFTEPEVFEVKITIKAARIEKGNDIRNKDNNKQYILNELRRRYKYLSFYKTFFHNGTLILNDAKKTYEVKLIKKAG